MRTYRLPAVLFIATACAAGGAWAQHMGEGRGLGPRPGPPATGPILPPQGNGSFGGGPSSMQASGPMMRSRGDRAGKIACLQKVSVPPTAAVLAVDQIGFEGGARCRIKIMRSSGVVQVISTEVER